MSKLGKLLSNPKLFAIDSRLYRRVALLARRAQRIASPKHDARWGPTADADALCSELIHELARRAPLVDLSAGRAPRVGILRSAIQEVTELAYELTHDRGMEVDLKTPNKQVTVRGERLFAIDDFITKARSFSLCVTLPSGEKLDLAIELWREEGDYYVGPRPNPILRSVPIRTAKRLGLFQRGRRTHGRSAHDFPLVDDPQFSIDVVYTWVNHQDPAWQQLHARATEGNGAQEWTDARSLDRFKNNDELKYSLRSVMKFAPWVRKIFVVSNCSAPPWLDTDHPKIEWVDHATILPPDCLPTFNSHAIEARLQHVPGLDDHFLYFNDDFFLTRPTLPRDFFLGNGLTKARMDPSAVVVGDPHDGDDHYLNAARNGKRLLEDQLERSAASLHLHAPYALRKDVLLEMEQRFEGPIAATARQRFRTCRDISTVSFLYHHYAYLTGRAVYTESDAQVITFLTDGYEDELASLLSSRARPISVCLNDGRGSSSFPRWERHITDFLRQLFPFPSELERAG